MIASEWEHFMVALRSSSRYINKNDVLAVGAPCFGISVFLTWCHVYECVTALQQHIAMHTERSCNSWKI